MIIEPKHHYTRAENGEPLGSQAVNLFYRWELRKPPPGDVPGCVHKWLMRLAVIGGFALFWLASVFVLPEPLIARADSGGLPPTAEIPSLVGHPQTLRLSCESRSAADWAAYWGVNIEELEFLGGLPRSDNPELGFVGDPDGPWGGIPPYDYGVHARPVADLLRQYGFEVEARKGVKWRELRTEIAEGRPVIVWVIGKMWTGTPVSYSPAKGPSTTVARYEHTMILTGYDPNSVRLIDASNGWLQVYPLETFLNSWSVLGNMAVIGHGQPPPTLRPGAAYRVKRGDYLVELARRFNVPWEELARDNGIAFPYVIHPGQALQLPDTAEADQASPTPTVANTPTPTSTLTPTPTPTHSGIDVPETYTVQKGEYLVQIARRYGLDWLELAKLNGIYYYPYVIYPGQVIRLR